MFEEEWGNISNALGKSWPLGQSFLFYFFHFLREVENVISVISIQA